MLGGRPAGTLAAALLFACLVAVLPGAAAGKDAGARTVVVIEFDHVIDKVSARFLSRSVGDAADDEAELIVVRLDTPGGLLSATRDIVGDILGSRVPVAVFVAPEGAQAASAGTFVGAAAGVLVMAPATNIGAAAVVGGQGEDLPKTLAKKATQDAVAFLRSIAERRGRPADALAATVLEARSYSAAEALELGIADVSARDLAGLLRTLDGRTVEASGGPVTVRTAGARVRVVRMGFFERVLAFLADPNVAFLLVSLGTLALAVELYNPGVWFPGAAGVIMLVLGFAGIGNLAFTWASLALFIVAVVLFVAEALHPGIGLLGAVGTAALVLAGILLVGSTGPPGLPGPSANVSTWLLVGIGSLLGLATLWLSYEFRRARKGPAYASPYAHESLVGEIAEVSSRLGPAGEVRVAGEAWSAELEGGGEAEIGERVHVSDRRGLTLVVRKLQATDSAAAEQGAAPPREPS